MKILVADDFEIMRHLVKNSLVGLGFSQIDESPDGLDADAKLDRAEKEGQPYQMIFCDWNMPGLAGIDLLEKCRSSEIYRNVPFVMITAESEQESIIKAVKLGATDYITKPFGASELNIRLQKVLERIKNKQNK